MPDFGYAVGDFIAIVKLAWQLYDSCYKVIKDAPTEFLALCNELAALGMALTRVQNDLARPDSKLRQHGDDRLASLKLMGQSMNLTLQQLARIVDKYKPVVRKTTTTTLWNKLRWTVEQNNIINLRLKLTSHVASLNLIISSIGNSSLERMEHILQRMDHLTMESCNEVDQSEFVDDDVAIQKTNPNSPNVDSEDVEDVGDRAAHPNDLSAQLTRIGGNISPATAAASFSQSSYETENPQSNHHHPREGVTTMLHLAAKNCWYSVVEKLLMTEDKDAKDATGMTPLHFAAKGGALEVVRLLLGHGASVNFEEDSGLTPLHCAIESSCEEIAELLLQFTELKAPRNGRWFPLHDATSKGSVRSVKWLLDKKFDLNLKGSKGELAIHVAASKGLDDIILLLLDQGSEINSTNIYGQTPLHRAVSGKKESTARLLFNRGADMTISDEEGNTAFYESVRLCSIKLAEFFLDNNADITICGAGGYSVLHVGAHYAYDCGEDYSLEMVKYLLRRGAPLEAECDSGNTPLDDAISLGFTSIARVFLVAGANTNRKNNIGVTPLHVAVEECKDKSLAMVKLLVGFKADVNATNNSGETPLQKAVELGNFAISMVLVESGSTLKTKNHKGNTLLHSSIYAGSLPLVEFFLPYCDVNEANINGETPLYFLLASGLSDRISRSLIARILINQGADFNGTDKTTGRALLHYAAEKDLETTKLLLECGLDPNCLDKEGCPPLHRSVVSCKTGYVAVLEYLLDLAVVDKGIRNHLGRTVLHMMTDCGPDARYDEANILVAKKIIERGVDINSQDKFGKSALHIAAAKCSDVLIKLLVEEGTNLKLRDQEGMTAFHVAAKNSRSEAVAILLLDGALDEAPSSLPPTLPLSKDRSETPKRKRI